MTDGVRAGRGWKLWLIFILGLIAAPLNAFGILVWAWAATHHATETAGEDATTIAALCALALVVIASIVGMARRWGRWVWGMSLILLFPVVFVLANALASLF